MRKPNLNLIESPNPTPAMKEHVQRIRVDALGTESVKSREMCETQHTALPVFQQKTAAAGETARKGRRDFIILNGQKTHEPIELCELCLNPNSNT